LLQQCDNLTDLEHFRATLAHLDLALRKVLSHSLFYFKHLGLEQPCQTTTRLGDHRCGLLVSALYIGKLKLIALIHLFLLRFD